MGIQEFRGSLKSIFSFENFAILLTFGLFLVQVAIKVLTTWFDYTGPMSTFWSGPYLILLVSVSGVLLAFSILRLSFHGVMTNKSAIAMIIVTGLLLAFLMIKFKTLTIGTLFEASVLSARQALGMP